MGVVGVTQVAGAAKSEPTRKEQAEALDRELTQLGGGSFSDSGPSLWWYQSRATQDELRDLFEECRQDAIEWAETVDDQGLLAMLRKDGIGGPTWFVFDEYGKLMRSCRDLIFDRTCRYRIFREDCTDCDAEVFYAGKLALRRRLLELHP